MEYKIKKFDITERDIIGDKYYSDDLIAPLWWSVSIYDGKEKYEVDLARFTPAQRKVFAVIWFDSEVNNGGIDQFLFNSTGIVWEDALAGFKLIGADKCAEILERVIEKCGGSIPFDREERQDMLEKITADPDDEDECLDIFEENDREYYDVNDDIDELIMNYAKAHASEFVFSGEVEVPENFE